MSLIKCPECGKEVSDKCKTCIHCGYPLINTSCIINGKCYDFSDELPMLLSDDYLPGIGNIRRKTSLTLYDACNLVEQIRDKKEIPQTFTSKYPLEDREKLYGGQDNLIAQQSITCPYCKSTDVKKITVTSKAIHTAVFGLFSLSRNSKNYHCNNCGSNF